MTLRWCWHYCYIVCPAVRLPNNVYEAKVSGGYLDNPSQSSCRDQPARQKWCNGSGRQETWSPGRIFPPGRIQTLPHPCQSQPHLCILLWQWPPLLTPELQSQMINIKKKQECSIVTSHDLHFKTCMEHQRKQITKSTWIMIYKLRDTIEA